MSLTPFDLLFISRSTIYHPCSLLLSTQNRSMECPFLLSAWSLSIGNTMCTRYVVDPVRLVVHLQIDHLPPMFSSSFYTEPVNGVPISSLGSVTFDRECDVHEVCR